MILKKERFISEMNYLNNVEIYFKYKLKYLIPNILILFVVINNHNKK